MTPGELVTSCTDLIVSAFADTTGAGTMAAGAGYAADAADPVFYSMIEDNVSAVVSAGTYTPTATLPGATSNNCWSTAAAAFTVK